MFYMCALTFFSNNQEFMKLYNNPSLGTSFVVPMVFNVVILVRCIPTYNYEHVWFVDVISWTKANKWKWIVLEKKLNLKIKHTLLVLLGAFQFSPNIDYIPFILDYDEEYFDDPQLSKCYCNVFIIF